jgi:phage N-6-adenine-methyltransferase
MADFDSNRFQSKKQTYETPDDLFLPLQTEFGFTLDVAADSDNTKCKAYFDEKSDGLKQPWSGVCWCNPPYREQSKWIKKAYSEAMAGRATTVLLVPARTNTGWWHDYCMKGEVRFIRGRPRFAGCIHGLPQPLALVIFRASPVKSIDLFSPK